MPRTRATPGERVRLELAYGVTLDLFVPHTPHHARALTLEARIDGATFSGKDLAMNMRDDSPGATVTVVEDDALGVSVAAADEVPVEFAVDADWLTVTPDADNPLRARITYTDPAAAGSLVGQSAVLTVSATLPDGTPARGTDAVTVVTGKVKTLTVAITDDAAG